MKKEIENKIILLGYVMASLIFAIPSILYLMQNKTVYKFIYVFSYSFKNGNNMLDTILYITLFFLLFFLYFMILRKANMLFKTKKRMYGFIFLIGVLFSIIIPNTSLDVYSYIGNGWVDSKYGENPYYVSVQDTVDKYGKDRMLGKVASCWRDEPVVYGPAWSLICRVLTSLSFGNIDVALVLFKIASLVVFMGCVHFMYRITNKRFFALLFGLNPFLLFESLTNVHNDIFLIFFVLLAIYFIKHKKQVALAIASLAIATGIKYLSILLVPFIIIYALQKERLRNKIKKTILYALEFILILIFLYAFYIKDLSVLAGIFVQQNKYGRSISLALWYFLNGDAKALAIIKGILISIFSIAYSVIVGKLFFIKQKKVIFRKIMQTYQYFLWLFTFLLITNFNPWYLIWLIPTLPWQSAKNIRITLYLAMGAITSYAITYATGIDNESVGIPYFCVMVGITLVLHFGHIFLGKLSLCDKR